MADITVKQGDTGPPVEATLTDASGNPVDIQGATFRFHMGEAGHDGHPIVNAAASNDQVGDGSDGSKGKVSYTWAAGDLANAGVNLYVAEFEGTFADGTIVTCPNDRNLTVQITPQIG